MRKHGFFRGRRQRSRGAALIEMVVAFMVLFYLVMGGVEFGWFMFAKHVTQSAARDGCRIGILPTATTAQVKAAVDDTMAAGGFAGIGYTISYQEVTGTSGGAVGYTATTDISTVDRANGLRVTVTAPFSAFRVRPLGTIPATKAVTGTTTMIKE